MKGFIDSIFQHAFRDVTSQGVPTQWLEKLASFERTDSLPELRFAAELTALLPRLNTTARRLTGEASSAEDLVQETMLRAWHARRSFQPGTNMRAWASTILKNIFYSSLRRRRWESAMPEHALELAGQPENQSSVADLNETLRLIETLPPDQRSALQKVALENMSYQDAAKLLGVNVGTIKSRVARARVALASMREGTTPAPAVTQIATTPLPTAPEPIQVRPSSLSRYRKAKAEGSTFLIG